MKKYLSLIIASVFIINVANARIWRVNNNSSVAADFTTAQAAHDAAAVGDTIHLEPSGNNYGDLTATKKLVWISIGNFLTVNTGLQVSSFPGYVGTLTINSGAANSNFLINAGATTVSANNITFLNSYIGGNLSINGNNCLFLKSWAQTNVTTQNGANGTIFSNSFIGTPSITNSSTGTSVVNCVIRDFSYISNCNIQNSIFKGGTYYLSNCSVQNSITCYTGYQSFPTANGNQNDVNATTIFVDASLPNDKACVLKSGSPAIGTGIGGIDMGMFGGGSPYVLGLQPPVPSITKLVAPTTVAGPTLNFTFSSKAN